MVKRLVIIDTIEKNTIVRSEQGKKLKIAMQYTTVDVKKYAKKEILKHLCNIKMFAI